MAGKSVNFNTSCNFSQFESIAKWLSCNGEVWGVGPTAVFASAAALFLYNELEATIFIPGDQIQDVSALEKTLISTMMLGMLALMVHLWVCCMRFFQYYLDTVIKDSPTMLLELTTVSLLGSQSNIVPLGPLTRFLRQQQPQIHITLCWFLSLCYADYVRKHYCQRFNMPYLEQWQTELQDRAVRVARQAMEEVNKYVASVHRRLRGYALIDTQMTTTPQDINTVGARLRRLRQWISAEQLVLSRASKRIKSAAPRAMSNPANRENLQQTLSKNTETILPWCDAPRPVSVHRTPASMMLSQQTNQANEDWTWRKISRLANIRHIQLDTYTLHSSIKCNIDILNH